MLSFCLDKIRFILLPVVCAFYGSLSGQSIVINVLLGPPTCSICCDGSFTVTTPGCTLQTIFISPTLTAKHTGPGEVVYTGACIGGYSILATAQGTCGTDSTVITMLYYPTGVKPLPAQEPDRLFPNPVTHSFFLSQTGRKSIEISDGAGTIVQYTTTSGQEIPVDQLLPGMYVVSVYSDKHVLLIRHKLLKQ